MIDNDFISPPVCGIDKKLAFHEKQCKSTASFSEQQRKDIAKELKCPCVGAENTIGRYRRKLDVLPDGKTIPTIAEANLKHIASITKATDSENEHECSWIAFSDPIWIEVNRLLMHESSGIPIDPNKIPAKVYEGFLFYKACANQIEAYEYDKIREKRERDQRDREVRARQSMRQ